MTPKHPAPERSDLSLQEDAAFKHRLRAMPDPQPSHGFDARLAELLAAESDAASQPGQAQPSGQQGLSGGAIALDWLRGLVGSPWGMALAFGVLLAVAVMLGLQWFSPEEDITKVDLLMLMSQELL